MNILVTGGNGQLGLSLKKTSGDYPGHTFVFTDLPDADVTDKEAMEALVKSHSAELIINCAAYTAVDKAESQPEQAEAVNCDGARNMAEIAAEQNIPLIHISTDYVFNGLSSKPYTEDDLPDPQSVYGRTKLDGELEVGFARCSAAVVRTSWLYSEFGHNFVRTMLRLAGDHKPLRIVDDQTGCPTYATDLARAVMQLAENGIAGFGIYNFCGEGSATWYGFAREIFRQTGLEIPVEAITTAEYPTAAKRPAYSVLSTEKIRAAGVAVPRWQESLAECLKALGWGMIDK